MKMTTLCFRGFFFKEDQDFSNLLFIFAHSFQKDMLSSLSFILSLQLHCFLQLFFYLEKNRGLISNIHYA